MADLNSRPAWLVPGAGRKCGRQLALHSPPLRIAWRRHRGGGHPPRYGAGPDRAEFMGTGILNDEEDGLTPVKQCNRDRSGNRLGSFVPGRCLELSLGPEWSAGIKAARQGARVTGEGDEPVLEVVSVQNAGLAGWCWNCRTDRECAGSANQRKRRRRACYCPNDTKS